MRLFIPSEYGTPTETTPQRGPLVHKAALQARLKEIGLLYTLIFSGALMETGLTPSVTFSFSAFSRLFAHMVKLCLSFLGIDLVDGKGIAGGDGNTSISWTSASDVASFLVHVLTTMPPSELEWRTFRIEGERAVSNLHSRNLRPSSDSRGLYSQ